MLDRLRPTRPNVPGYLTAFALLLVGVVFLFIWAFRAVDATGPESRKASVGNAQVANAPEVRPDLVQRTPQDIAVEAQGRRSKLGFASAVENHGDGPLLVEGSRPPGARDMAAHQIVERRDGSRARFRTPAVIRFTRGKHNHWHYLRFDRYELRRASDHERVRPDFKSGFCLGDRYDTKRKFPAKPRRAMLRGQCRPDEPGALTVGQGISVGYGDDYPAYLEGQSIDITGLPSGRYELVHRVNVDRRLRESDYSNNSASVLLNIDQGRKRADMRLLQRCPGEERCPNAG